jgi:hypothetical protein
LVFLKTSKPLPYFYFLFYYLLCSGQPLTSWVGPWWYLNHLSDLPYSSNYY